MVNGEHIFKPEFISSKEQGFDIDFQSVAIGGSAEPYEGQYEVTPTVEGLTLETANKYMSDDVTVKAIPTYEVSNNAGGTTFYIAKE